MTKLKLKASVHARNGGVELRITVGDWTYNCLARGNTKQWTPKHVELLARTQPNLFQVCGHGQHSLFDIIHLV